MGDNSNSSGAIAPLEEPKNKDDTTSLFVSLYLIVLAFFVVLNSISNQDQGKVDAATESVTRAFKNPYAPESDFVDVIANEEAETPNDEFYDQIMGLFASLIGFEGRFPTMGGKAVRVTFKASDIFEEETTNVQPRQYPFIEELASFLNEGLGSEKREINIVMSSGKVLPKGPKFWEDLIILRVGAFVKLLKDKGVEEDKISIGVVKGQDDLITMTLFTRERKTASQSLAGHETTKTKMPAEEMSPKILPKTLNDTVQTSADRDKGAVE